MKLPTAASCGVSAPLPEQRQLSIHRLFCWAALLLNVALDDLLGRAFPHRPDIAPVTPKLSTPKHATNFWMHTKHLPRCDALHHLHNPRRRPTPARPNKHMHMIPVRSHLLDLIPIPLANLPQRLHQGLPILRLPKHLLAVLDAHDHVIPDLIHTMAAEFNFHSNGLYPFPFPCKFLPAASCGVSFAPSDEISKTLVEAAIEVQREWGGPGLLEDVFPVIQVQSSLRLCNFAPLRWLRSLL